ncbi:ABC transporter ATP-binding protein [Oryzomonas japonica]|uniref:ABC transporter ATP-binding protein n=1 Tax=Oryzomonas japonica TaxID=2603858 RepID=A0A7J4ZMU2_9BACT|nr:ABC transporter ATP-binding protein [Oryzomonas japonica]KAB0663898.1 ABC transporter ATP-binding protein [Oryzomonas japonica]
MIEAVAITKTFPISSGQGRTTDKTVLQSVSLTIGDGAFVSLVGPTGCGKSTFLEILAGLQAPSHGEVRIDGTRLLEPLPNTPSGIKAYRKKHRFLSPIANSLFRNKPRHDIAMIFQDYAVFPWMTARQNVQFVLGLRGVPRGEREKLARHYLAMVGLEEAANSYPAHMSGGMRQRLALARAFSAEPGIILMDEPFAAVDALTREKLQDDLVRLWETSGITIVLATHDVGEAVCLSDEVYVFSPAPGAIRGRVAIDVPRPRRHQTVAVQGLKEQVLSHFLNT